MRYGVLQHSRRKYQRSTASEIGCEQPDKKKPGTGDTDQRGLRCFLAIVCTLCIAACVAYVKLQTVVTTQAEDITSKEKELSDLKADNDAYYNTTVASEDLEAVKEAAQNRLGMKYADESQVIYFNDSENSYVRQYQDVPDAK